MGIRGIYFRRGSVHSCLVSSTQLARRPSPLTILQRGRVYGMLNGKYVFLSAVFIFELDTAVCGAAPTMDALIVGRTLCGVGRAL